LGTVNDFGTLTGSVVGTAVAITLVPAMGDDLTSNCRSIIHSVAATQQTISATFTVCGHTGTINIEAGLPPTMIFINIGDDSFFPTKLSISKGPTVRWTNNGREGHSVNANPGTQKCKPLSGAPFDPPTVNTGGIFERTFNNAGTFTYHCEIHGCQMKGTITVH
jgi:plastocyanin